MATRPCRITGGASWAQGPSTSGMGSSRMRITPSSCGRTWPRTLHPQKVAEAITETGDYYRVMYGGFLITRDGVRLVEYNARFRDPGR